MITLSMIEQHQTEWEALNAEFARLELEENSRFIRNPETGEIWWPSPWIQALHESPTLSDQARLFNHLDPENLAPMSMRLQELASFFHLPLYEGQAEPNPLPGTKSFKKQVAKLRRAQGKCSFCGGKLIPTSVASWDKAKAPGGAFIPPPTVTEAEPLICKDCGQSA